jgi:hypothetical protein
MDGWLDVCYIKYIVVNMHATLLMNDVQQHLLDIHR